jgi:hypothetical protein
MSTDKVTFTVRARYEIDHDAIAEAIREKRVVVGDGFALVSSPRRPFIKNIALEIVGDDGGGR